MIEFTQDRQGTGTREWSEHSFNIGLGCQHACLYCYARANAMRFKRILGPNEWTVETLKHNAIARGWDKRDGVIMFPTAHDITPYYLDWALIVLLKILDAGNRVLVVSKPHLKCVEKMTEILASYKDQLLFRFTIGSLDPQKTIFWEPGAPLPMERVRCLQLAFERGFQTSVSMEPMLAGIEDALATFLVVKEFVTEKIWIGKMNKIRQRVDMRDKKVEAAVNQIELLQRDAEINRLYEKLRHSPKVAWKDSIKEVVKRYA